MHEISMLPMPGGTISAQAMDAERYKTLDAALSHVLHTKIAHESISQLMDGLPLWPVYCQSAALINTIDAPIQQHVELCNGAEEMADAFIASFSTANLIFDAAELQSFQNAEHGSRAFQISLLMLVARAVHCIGASIDKQAQKTHDGDIAAVTSHQDPVEHDDDIIFPPYANMFHHYMYTDHEQYPLGAADMAGYWLEDRIFGGVVLFDRGKSGKEANSVWLHSARWAWTRRVWRLLDWQYEAIISFFLHGPDPNDPLFDTLPVKPAPRTSRDCPSSLRMSKFPFFCDIDNLGRHDEWDAMAIHNIYRDPWERKLPDEKIVPGAINTFDYPEQGVLVSKVLEDMKTAPRYRAVAPTDSRLALDTPYDQLTQEEKYAGTLAALDFRIERMSPELTTDEEHESQKAIADNQGKNDEENNANGDATGNANRLEGHTADMAEISHDNNTKDTE